ncbi:MAG: HPP family protein [Magnetococcales bacterium]|nr:HPP family protein [Magnetococcales bacterium]
MSGLLKKMAGGGTAPEPMPLREMFWSWLGAFLGIGLVAWLHERWFVPRDLVLILGSFGASAVLIHGAITSPLAQPRNLLGGHLLSGVVGVAVFQGVGQVPWLAAALAVSLAIVVMQWTRTLHPPGGATALIAVIGSDEIHSLGWLYPLAPALSGALIMLLVALVVNNLAPGRRYPLQWWPKGDAEVDRRRVARKPVANQIGGAFPEGSTGSLAVCSGFSGSDCPHRQPLQSFE